MYYYEKDGKMGWMGTKKGFEKNIPFLKKVPRLFCNLHKIGANIYNYWQSLLFCAKKYGHGWMGGWMGGWMDGRARLSIAYNNQKLKM